MLSLYKVKCKYENKIDKKENREIYRYIFANDSKKAEKMVEEYEGYDGKEGKCHVVSSSFIRNVTEKELKEGVTEGAGGSDWEI